MKVLFGICSWGLGHAVRDLPLIKRMIREDLSVTVVSDDRSLDLIKDELGNSCVYREIPDYPPPYSEKDFSLIKFLAHLPVYFNDIAREHKEIEKLTRSEGYERIISDSRFGVFHRKVPSFFLFHQLRFIAPGRIKLFERATEGFNYLCKRKFKKFLVPDWEEDGLSGDLSHNLHYFKNDKVEYLGPICDFERKNTSEDIDYFISISGPEPQRSIFEEKILSQLSSLKGRVIVALGKPEQKLERSSNGVKIFSYLNRKKQEEIMNRSRLIIARPGYTTLMELAFLGKKALLVPTPGQTEQVYLADYHKQQGNFHSVPQGKLDLARDAKEAEKYPGLNKPVHSGKAEEKFMRIVFNK